MKERYDSEKGLKKAFENYQMPIDNAAFEKFSLELDKEEKKKRFIWWLYYGKIIFPLIIVGLIALTVYNPLSNNSKEVISENSETSNSDNRNNSNTANTKQADSDKSKHISSATKVNTNSSNNSRIKSSAITNNEDESITEVSLPGEEKLQNNPHSKTTIEQSQSQLKDSNTKLSTSADSRNETLNQNRTLNRSQSNSTNSIANQEKSVGYGNSKSTSIGLKSNTAFTTPTPLGSIEPGPSLIEIEDSEKSRLKIEGFFLLDLLGPKDLYSQFEKSTVAFDKEINPYKVPFKKYFYFNVGGGVTIEDNHGPFNNLFKVSKTNDFFWRTSVAYQVSPTTAFEFSFMQKNTSIGFQMKDIVYTEKYTKKISLFKLNVVNRIWNINNRININMMNGISLIKAPGHINDFPDAKNTFQIGQFPNSITNIDSEWKGLYDGPHFLYSGGLNMNIMLSKMIELNVAAEYTLGFKSLMSADLNYIEGEGIIRQLQAKTTSSFASASIGLKYKLKK